MLFDEIHGDNFQEPAFNASSLKSGRKSFTKEQAKAREEADEAEWNAKHGPGASGVVGGAVGAGGGGGGGGDGHVLGWRRSEPEKNPYARHDVQSEEENEGYYASDDGGGNESSFRLRRDEEGDEREYEDEDRPCDGGNGQSPFEPGNNGGSEFKAEYGQSWENEEEGAGDTDIEEDVEEGNGCDRSGGGHSGAEDEETCTLDPAATMEDAAKDGSLPTRRRQRPKVRMHSYESEDEITGGGDCGGVQAAAEMNTETSEVEVSVFGAIGLGGNYSAKPAVRAEGTRVAAARRPFVVPVWHSSMDTATTTIQPNLMVVGKPPRPTDTHQDMKAEVGSSSTGFNTKQRGSMAVSTPHEQKAPFYKWLEIGNEALRKSRGPPPPPPPPPPRERTVAEIQAADAAFVKQNKGKVTRRWATPYNSAEASSSS